ncbi:MAG: Mg chelatase-like protein [Candidatus Woesebacteria bacterium GW2011_GWA1_33_30]|uniref:Mg chelatase-like protein n=1 Tax=Candidatus Woesebacteria bacterium GW2011_GWA2_33_28 TaxID=1618561 RepID=A0A0F9ZTM0_9BACT|nr:MAG: Mg chelatase-like protein [Candidatus Woesebacteria bacterium GW2011_GWA2_33_28]KKP48491.1 MAG: Mg chelatase-like protein [Candidatus Woesebacteria bacterium GW2011_GWA1_33_30]KKP49629.1 MAG: Mg chelatase-like protein [Microgenomates group bacterium GW2011_GWC1_33_32]KKP52246.1 MAG: Mg chelatase-like protein [Candidatus Woesebacteria bacterium GW2011_GWB1_33_38]KKP58081.1 MAG: Mg chelatase-like protein [Microgenomates group bacterium GW2011_GWD1_33_9]
MLTKILSASHFGLEPNLIEVEVNVFKKGFPGFNIIGLPNKSIEEAKERVKTALINSNIEIPNSKIVVNLAPADIPKEGSLYDLPIAIGILASLGEVKLPQEKSFFYGELSLDGGLRHTKGVFLLGLAAKALKIKNLFVPFDSANEAVVLAGIDVYPVKSLLELVSHLNGIKKIEKMSFSAKASGGRFAETQQIEFDFAEIIGQESAKRAMTIAAAGGHNIFMMGSPGAGKTMLARASAGILPPLNEEEALEVTKIYSLAGLIPAGEGLVSIRPFRTAHHTTSRIGLIGGGTNPHPGEISLAHNGVLFLDEFPEFSRSTLEALRQPMEDGEVSITRIAGSVNFPASFMLIAAANPCPCGYLGDPKKDCKCTPRMIMKYQSKLSGPLMDRIDLHINVPAVDINKLMENANAKTQMVNSKKIREQVIKAREIQNKRFRGLSVYTNSNMKNKHIKGFVDITPEALSLLKQAVNTYNLSARTYFRLIKVSQTIADLSESKKILPNHVAEALQYRVRSE